MRLFSVQCAVLVVMAVGNATKLLQAINCLRWDVLSGQWRPLTSGKLWQTVTLMFGIGRNKIC
jgi:hypothetical protein